MKKERLQYGMVGGDLTAFIGNVHRAAIGLDPRVTLAAGCFNNVEPEKNKATGEAFKLEPDRVYSDYKEMALKESQRTDKLDFIVITTPNAWHYEIAKEFLEKGFNIVCEKPLCFEIKQAEELEKLAKEKDLLFMVNYAYSGYVMMKFARELVMQGKLGKIINVNAEYPQEWLIDQISGSESNTAKLSGWRFDPKIAGRSNCVGDIGSHIEHTVSYITGLKIKRVAARTDYFGHPLEMNANILLEYDNGAAGVYWTSQVAIGHMNGLRVRIYGTDGSLEWAQETPEYVKFTPRGEAPQFHYRGAGYMKGRAAEQVRIPSGHVEGYHIAFANLYRTYTGAVLKKANGEALTEKDLDFPNVSDGVEGVKFIHAVIDSGLNDSKWVSL